MFPDTWAIYRRMTANDVKGSLWRLDSTLLTGLEDPRAVLALPISGHEQVVRGPPVPRGRRLDIVIGAHSDDMDLLGSYPVVGDDALRGPPAHRAARECTLVYPTLSGDQSTRIPLCQTPEMWPRPRRGRLHEGRVLVGYIPHAGSE